MTSSTSKGRKRSILQKVRAGVDESTAREFARPWQNEVALMEGTSTEVVVHEIGHLFEANSGVERAAQEFADRRAGTVTQSLNQSLMTDQFKADEFTRTGWRDGFGRAFLTETEAAYAAKKYQKYTEVVSMGLEQLYKDPSRMILGDPEYAAFVLDVLGGEYDE